MVEKCKVEHFISELYEEAMENYKNMDSVQGKRKALDDISKNSYEKFLKEKGHIDKKEFLIGFHRFYNKIEKEIKDDISENNDRIYLMDRLQKLDYEIYREKKDYLEPIKKYMSLLTIFNIIIFLILTLLIYDRFISRSNEKEKLKEKLISQELSFIENKNEIKKLDEEIISKSSDDFFHLGREAHLKKDYKKAYLNYLEAEKLGNFRASYILGLFYFQGYYVERDYHRALELWKKASDNSVVEANHSLAIAYIRAFGVEKNYDIAKKYLRKAIEGGLVEAYYNLANLYYLEKAYKEAIELWEKGYKEGHVESGRSLTNLYLYGPENLRNRDRAREILKEIS